MNRNQSVVDKVRPLMIINTFTCFPHISQYIYPAGDWKQKQMANHVAITIHQRQRFVLSVLIYALATPTSG